MQWRDNLLPASFNGVKFHVKQHTYTAGVNIANENNNGFRNNSSDGQIAPKEMQVSTAITASVKKKNYDITAFIIGTNYFDDKKKLITQLDKLESGVLVHPFFGSLYVKPTEWSVTESFNNGGMATFSLKFQEDLDAKQTAYETFRNTYFSSSNALIKAKILNFVKDLKKNKTVTERQIKTATKKLKQYIFDDRIDDIKDLSSAFRFLDDYYDAIDTISTIPAMLSVANDIFYNNVISPYHKLKAVFQSIFLATNDKTNYNTKDQVVRTKNAILESINVVSEEITEQEIFKNIQDIKIDFIDFMQTAPVPLINTKTIYNKMTWLTLLQREKQTIDNEDVFRKLNSNKINPLFYTGEVYFNVN